jgi:hypothetical protein
VGLISRECFACVADPLMAQSSARNPPATNAFEENSLKEMSKTQYFDEGIFVKFGPKNSRAARVGAFSSHQTEQLDGRGWIEIFCNFLGCN